MAKEWICTVCGYVAEGEEAPAKCPQCGAPASKFKEYIKDSEGAMPQFSLLYTSDAADDANWV